MYGDLIRWLAWVNANPERYVLIAVDVWERWQRVLFDPDHPAELEGINLQWLCETGRFRVSKVFQPGRIVAMTTPGGMLASKEESRP